MVKSHTRRKDRKNKKDVLVRQLSQMKREVISHKHDIEHLKSFVYANPKYENDRKEKLSLLQRLLEGKKQILHIMSYDFKMDI